MADLAERFGRYELRGELGRGGFATVYRAWDPSLDREVALKALLTHLAADEAIRQRFQGEARAIARLHHPNVITVYEVAETDERPFFTMEMIGGPTLSTLVTEVTQLPLSQVAQLIRGLASAVDYLHSRRLVHRDIKASNVMLDTWDRVVLMDFGVARALDETHLTRSGISIGTPEAMSPEQVRGHPAGPPADIYAVGILAYRLLAGRPPFMGDSIHVIHAHAYDEPPSLALFRPGLPRSVYTAIESALAKDPDERPSLARAIADALVSAASFEERDFDPSAATLLATPPRPYRESHSSPQDITQITPPEPAGRLATPSQREQAPAAPPIGPDTHAPAGGDRAAAPPFRQDAAKEAESDPVGALAPDAERGPESNEPDGDPAAPVERVELRRYGLYPRVVAPASAPEPPEAVVPEAQPTRDMSPPRKPPEIVPPARFATPRAAPPEQAPAVIPAAGDLQPELEQPTAKERTWSPWLLIGGAAAIALVLLVGGIIVSAGGGGSKPQGSPVPTAAGTREGALSATAGSASSATAVTASTTAAPAGATAATSAASSTAVRTAPSGSATAQPAAASATAARTATPVPPPPPVTGTGRAGYVDGSALQAQFNSPKGVAVDSAGAVYVADTMNSRIRKIENGTVTTVAGPGADVSAAAGYSDQPGAAARFNQPRGIAIDQDGNLYVADTLNNRIRRIDRGGAVSTFAGGGGTDVGSGSFADGAGTQARFSLPTGIAVAADGTLYVADSRNNAIRKIDRNGTVTTLAGATASGRADGQGTAARFNSPTAVAMDAQGNVFVADTFNNLIRRIGTDGQVTTYAGGGAATTMTGAARSVAFVFPEGIAVDSAGNVYVADQTHTIRRIAADGAVTVLAGSKEGFSNELGAQAQFDFPSGLSLTADGMLYVADTTNNRVRTVPLR